MKKILSIALILGATALLACPMQGGGMMNNPQGMMGKCGCDTSKLPKPMEQLGLSDDQKMQMQKIREEGKAFHNQQHEKMMAVMTPEQRAKLDALRPMNPKQCAAMKGGKMAQPQMPAGGMGCKNCPKE
ncbi:MAG: hypothetical protein PHW64_05115 [Sulfuricurvum sp.]|nr:hypothetical protein [Sulfuricurvum sp.]